MPAPGGTTIHVVDRAKRCGLDLTEEQMNDLPQAALGDAGDIPVNGHDPLEMNGGLIVIPQHLEFRMIDDQPPVGFLDLSINANLLPCGDDLLDEWHVEPAAGDFPGAEN